MGDERRKSWAKVVTWVDEQKSSGWAYEGEFIAVGGVQDVPAGSVVLVYGERGSRANPNAQVAVFVATADGTLSKRAEASGQAWARTLRDPVAELLEHRADVVGSLEWRPELMLYSDEAIEREAVRRGLGTGAVAPDR